MRTGFEINFLELYYLKYNVLCTDYNNLVENPVNLFSFIQNIETIEIFDWYKFTLKNNSNTISPAGLL